MHARLAAALHSRPDAGEAENLTTTTDVAVPVVGSSPTRPTLLTALWPARQ